MIINFFEGILIGIAGIIPGLSGAVLAMIFGLYNDMIHSVSNFFKDIKKNLIFLFPIVFGIAIGFVLFSNVQKILLQKYPFQTMMVIIGLIIGTVPILFTDSQIKKLKLSYIIVFGIALFVGLCMNINEPTIDVQNKLIELSFSNILNLILIGFIMAGSHIIPGISGTVILMILGSYGIMLNAVANLKDLFLIEAYTKNLDTTIYNILIISFIGIGLLIGAIIFSKLMDYLLKHFYKHTYCVIIGFVIGSIPSIVPAIEFNNTSIIGILLLLISVFVSYKVSLLSK